MSDRYGLPYIFEFNGKGWTTKYIADFSECDDRGYPLITGGKVGTYRSHDFAPADIKERIECGSWILTTVIQYDEEPMPNMEDLI